MSTVTTAFGIPRLTAGEEGNDIRYNLNLELMAALTTRVIYDIEADRPSNIDTDGSNHPIADGQLYYVDASEGGGAEEWEGEGRKLAVRIANLWYFMTIPTDVPFYILRDGSSDIDDWRKYNGSGSWVTI